MIWNKLLSMVVRVSHFSIIFFLFKYYLFIFCVFFVYFLSFLKCSDTLYTISFAFDVKSFEEALSVVSNVQTYKTDWTLSLPIHVNGVLLINEINEIAQKTQCFTLPCHSIQCRFDFTNIIIKKEICCGSNPRLSDSKQCSLTPRPSRYCPTS